MLPRATSASPPIGRFLHNLNHLWQCLSRRFGLEGPSRALRRHIDVSMFRAPSQTAPLRTRYCSVPRLRVLRLPQEEPQPELAGRQLASASARARLFCRAIASPAQVLPLSELQPRVLQIDLAKASAVEHPDAQPAVPDAASGEIGTLCGTASTSRHTRRSPQTQRPRSSTPKPTTWRRPPQRQCLLKHAKLFPYRCAPWRSPGTTSTSTDRPLPPLRHPAHL